MDLINFWQAIQGNLISVGIGLCIFIMAYVSNMCFSTYYNVRILGEQFEPSKLKMSGLKILTFGIGTALLTMAITLILPWANQNGLNIPDEYTAYCFDEVCAEIVLTMTDEKEPKEPKFDVPHKHYKSFTELYKQFELII